MKRNKPTEDEFVPMPERKCPKCKKMSTLGLELMGRYIACDECTNKHLAAGGSFESLENAEVH